MHQLVIKNFNNSKMHGANVRIIVKHVYALEHYIFVITINSPACTDCTDISC